MNLLLFAEKDVHLGDGRSWCSKPQQANICLLEALVGRGHTGTLRLKNCAALRKNKTCVLVMVTQAVFVIGLETHGVQIYDVARGCLKKKISWKLCIFIISGSHLACVVFTSALGPIVRLKNYEWFLSLTWFKKRMPSLKNVNFSYHVSCAINACDKSVGVSLSKWLWKFARPCQQQFPSAAESLGCVNAGVWDRDWGEQHARRTLFSPIELQSLSSPFSGEILAECPPFICSPRQSSSPNDPHFSIFYTPEMGTAPIPLFLFIFHSFLSVRLCVFTFLHSNAKCMLSCWLPQIFRGLPTFYNPPVTGRSTR